MRITAYEVKMDGRHIASTPIREQAMNAAKKYAFQNRTPVSVTAFIDDGRMREINVHPDGTIDRLWEKSGTAIIVGHVYTNHNGSDYLCKSIPDNNSAEMERIKDGWTLIAHGIEKHGDGTIEWDYSTGGHWVKTSLDAKLQAAKQEMKNAGPKQQDRRVRQAERG